jgi:maltooligosyltrehalose trehalohydrolase
MDVFGFVSGASARREDQAVISSQLGANVDGRGRIRFLVWAPRASRVEVHLVSPSERVAPLEPLARGYHAALVDGAPPCTRYFYRLDGAQERPDPASRFQPEGVHGPSEVVDADFEWHDRGWHGVPLSHLIIYELHVGAFTPEGTFDAAAAHLDDLRTLGVTAIELMPVAQFPGSRNWGYDGTYPFAVQNSYGGPHALKRFVDTCHARGLAVLLDVVYNHLGPEGNYLAEFAPYFTDRYRTPWGPAINFDGPESDEVRRYFLENAVRWVSEFHFDGLRLDAIHAIVDTSAYAFLEELGVVLHEQADQLNRHVHVIPESDLGDSRIITVRELGGYGLDAQWSDDFHHSLHTLLTRETAGYYHDFGSVEHLARAYRSGFVYQGEYSGYRRRRFGSSTQNQSAPQFVVAAQNHDQVGNRLLGDRLATMVPFAALKVAAAAVILSPFTPLLFMGEEYGEMSPFPFFADHSDADIIAATRAGRHQEFAAFRWEGEIPDPFAEDTFLQAKLGWDRGQRAEGRALTAFYTELIRLRKTFPAFRGCEFGDLDAQAWERERVLLVRRRSAHREAALILSFGPGAASAPLPAGEWRKLLDSNDGRWNGPGTAIPEKLISDGSRALDLHAHSAILLARTEEVNG